MTENDVRELLLGRGVDFASHATILATLKPTVGSYNLGMGEYMNVMREHVLHSTALASRSCRSTTAAAGLRGTASCSSPTSESSR